MQTEIGQFYAEAWAGMSNNDKIHMLHYLGVLRDNFSAIDRRQGDED